MNLTITANDNLCVRQSYDGPSFRKRELYYKKYIKFPGNKLRSVVIKIEF